MYESILVPTDGSNHATQAAVHGFALARAFDATVHVINVVDLQTEGGLFNAGGVDEEFIARCEARGQEAIDEIEAHAHNSDTVKTEVLRGAPSDTILEYADNNDVDLIAMGTHGRRGLDRYIAGSVTERVVRLANVPVLTVRANEHRTELGSFEHILIPTDGSDCAAAAIEHGIEIAKAFDATVHALSVVDVGAIAMSSDIVPAAETVNRLEKQGQKATDEIATRARNAGLSATTAVEEGFPAKDILGYANDNDVDLITMGTHGWRGIDRVLLGSTTERTIRRAEMPVLSVRPDEKKSNK